MMRYQAFPCAVLMAGATWLTGWSNPASAKPAPDKPIPGELDSKYAASPSSKISDEFNDGSLDSQKWAYRTKGEGWATGSDYVSFVTEAGDSYVSIKGLMETKLGAGIVTKEPAHFGFYSIRWRTDGISRDFMTPWHPAIWMAAQNFATGDDARSIKHAGKNVEIDFVEYWHQPVWHCQTIPWGWEGEEGEKKPVQKMLPERNDFATTETGWQEHGLEYHPEYFQAWEKVDGAWKRIGTRIPINDDPVSKESLNKDHATPGYWILSNKYHFDNVSKLYMFRNGLDRSKFRFEDSSLQLDHFRYFPLK